jgi:hypothetical protein
LTSLLGANKSGAAVLVFQLTVDDPACKHRWLMFVNTSGIWDGVDRRAYGFLGAFHNVCLGAVHTHTNASDTRSSASGGRLKGTPRNGARGRHLSCAPG